MARVTGNMPEVRYRFEFKSTEMIFLLWTSWIPLKSKLKGRNLTSLPVHLRAAHLPPKSDFVAACVGK